MKWKVGDKIKLKTLRAKNEEREPYVSLNKIYIIITVENNTDYISIRNNSNGLFYILKDNLKRVYKRKTKNEFKLLDRLQSNEKEYYGNINPEDDMF